MNKETMTKIFSTTLSLALVASSIPVNAAGPMSPVAPSFVAGLTPPERFGYVASSYAPNNEEKPRLIIIADLHGHIDVQKNIVGMLDHFVSKLTDAASGNSMKRVPIFVEGGWQSNLEEPLKVIANPKVRAVVGAYLFQKADLPASQVYSEAHPGATNITLTGVENKEYYEANTARFVETYPVRKRILTALARREEAMAVVRQNVEPAAVQKLHRLRVDYDRGIVNGDLYARVLLREAAHLGIQNRSVEVLKQARANHDYSGEFDLALMDLHRQAVLGLSQDKPFRAMLRPSVKDEDLVRKNLAYADSMLDLLKRLVANQLTPEEVPYALANMPRLIQVAQMLLQNEKLDFDLGQAIERCLDFYPFAIARNKILMDNSLAALASDPTHPTTGILIAGGFHVEAIAESLKAKGISYLLVDPVVTRDMTANEQLNYISRLCGDKVTPQEMAFDFAHSWGQKLVREAVEIGPITGDQKPIEKGPGTTGLYTQLAKIGQNAVFAHLGNPEMAKKFGIAYDAGKVEGFVNKTDELESRRAAIAQAALDNQIQLGVIDLSKGTTLKFDAGLKEYRAEGADATDYTTLVEGLNTRLKTLSPKELSQEDDILVQPVDGIQAQAQATDTASQGTTSHSLSTEFMAVNLGKNGKQKIIFVNNAAQQDLKEENLKKAAQSLKANTKLSETAAQRLETYLSAIHEGMHPTTVAGQKGFVGEGFVTRDSLAAFVMQTAKLAGGNAVSLSHDGSFTVADWFVRRALQSVQQTIDGEETVNNIMEALPYQTEYVSVKELAEAIGDVLDPVALQAKAEQAVMAELASRHITEVTEEEVTAYLSGHAMAAAMTAYGGKNSVIRDIIEGLRAKAVTLGQA